MRGPFNLKGPRRGAGLGLIFSEAFTGDVYRRSFGTSSIKRPTKKCESPPAPQGNAEERKNLVHKTSGGKFRSTRNKASRIDSVIV